MLSLVWLLAVCGSAAADASPAASSASSLPNIVLILADDLGYGDVRSFNPQCRIATPHLDRLAREGMCLTDAHSSSSVCTPTRYSLLTGRYNWRTRLKSGVLGGLSPPLLEPTRMTLASLLKNHGYHCACIGKWHLGLDWARKPGAPPFRDVIEKGEEGWRVDFARPFGGGPTTVGFDKFFGISASLDMVPYTFLEDDRVTAIPTVDMHFEMMQGVARQMTRKGPGAIGFTAEEVLPTFTQRSIHYIQERAPQARAGRPFFLYLPLASPHTPIAPTKDGRGRSGLNPYGDFVEETDAAIGRILEALDQSQIAQQTLVIVTSDNGCSPQADFAALRAKGHDPSYSLRGHKADIFEGGHRVPMIVRWPGRTPAGSNSNHLVGLVDWLATLAEIVGESLPDDAGEDSVSFLPVLLGRQDSPPRPALVHHSINGAFAIREGRWKLILDGSSGGWSDPLPGSKSAADLPSRQLYDLQVDQTERKNLSNQHPDIVARLELLLEKYRSASRSVPLKISTLVPPKR